ncbi:MAG: DUF2064 domain-containing protein [Deltaproteobacteria bacterium]|nr:DUF2064 domain-containing protein [Deltaproteobacteria bacterium]
MSPLPVKEALIVFMRYPEAGQVKSRLAASVGFSEAAGIYEKLLRRTLGVVTDFITGRPHVQAYLFFTPPGRRVETEGKFPGPWQFQPQEGKHLGERMGRADLWARDRGFTRVVLVGTDVPALEVKDLEDAFDTLNCVDAVFGPASDGGFYLIGLRRSFPPLFSPSEWGVAEVLGRSETMLVAAGRTAFRLRTLGDVDRAEDLSLLGMERLFQDRLTVVIPTVSSPATLKELLCRLQVQTWPGDEIIMVCAEDGMDGTGPGPSLQRGEGSFPRNGGETCGETAGEENTLPGEVDLRSGVTPLRCIRAPRGRGLQMNAGVAAARGNLLFFLHDDSLPPAGFAYSIRKTCGDPQVSVGCFRLAFSPSNRALDAVAAWANFRSRFLKIPYGDQGLFCSKAVFEILGGFRFPFLMEDLDFVKRAGRLGKVAVLPQRITTSPRRYLEKGVLRASFQNHALMFLHLLGVDNRKLYSAYYGAVFPVREDCAP